MFPLLFHDICRHHFTMKIRKGLQAVEKSTDFLNLWSRQHRIIDFSRANSHIGFSFVKNLLSGKTNRHLKLDIMWPNFPFLIRLRWSYMWEMWLLIGWSVVIVNRKAELFRKWMELWRWFCWKCPFSFFIGKKTVFYRNFQYGENR